jgi:hypothetical protein
VLTVLPVEIVAAAVHEPEYVVVAETLIVSEVNVEVPSKLSGIATVVCPAVVVVV